MSKVEVQRVVSELALVIAPLFGLAKSRVRRLTRWDDTVETAGRIVQPAYGFPIRRRREMMLKRLRKESVWTVENEKKVNVSNRKRPDRRRRWRVETIIPYRLFHRP